MQTDYNYLGVHTESEVDSLSSLTLSESLLGKKEHEAGRTWRLQDLSSLDELARPCWVFKYAILPSSIGSFSPPHPPVEAKGCASPDGSRGTDFDMLWALLGPDSSREALVTDASAVFCGD